MKKRNSNISIFRRNPYISIFKMKAINTFQYRTAAFAGIVTQFFFGFMYLALYKTFMSQGIEVSDFSVEQMVSYVWLQQVCLAIFFGSSADAAIAGQIVKGDICYSLIRPMNLYNNWYATCIAKRVVNFLLRSIPMSIIVLLLPAGVGLSLPVSWLAFLLFLTALVLSIFLIEAFFMLAYVLVFKTMSPKSTFNLISLIVIFFNGTAIAVPFMPEIMQKIMDFLPFRYTADLTLRIYNGSIPVSEAWIQILIQIGWTVGLIILGKLLMKRVLKKVEVQGG